MFFSLGRSALVVATTSAALLPTTAGAQNRPSEGPRLASAAGATANIIRVQRGAKITLPFVGVTRIITEDEEVARATFAGGGRAVLEGVGAGQTLVEIYQGTETPRLLTVSVQEIAATSAPATSAPATSAPSTALPPSASLNNNAAPIVSPIAMARSPLTVSLGVAPAPGAASQALFTVTYGNPGNIPVTGAVVRFTLDETVSYVTGSGTAGARYDAVQREVTWNVGTVAAGTLGQKVQLRVEPIERRTQAFEAVATIEDNLGGAIVSNQVRYSTATTPLLTVFALPDRFLAGKTGPVLVDVKGVEFQSAVDRLQSMGVVSGRQPGFFAPEKPTQRAEYAVMTLNGLNLRDLRDITQIKFVLGRRSTVDLTVLNEAGKPVATLVRSTIFEPGEHTAVWNGRVGGNYAAPGRYTYVCSARDINNQITSLKGNLTIVSQTPLVPRGTPTFVDVKATDWYAGYLSIGEKQGLLVGYSDKTFKPLKSISRVEATAIVVRALGLEDLARQWQDKDVGFLDYQNIEPWARGYVNVASSVAKTTQGRPIMRGRPSNFFEPNRDLRRDEAALIVQRLIDREQNRRISVSGALVPGATVTINSRAVEADDQGRFAFSVESNTSQPTTVAVIDSRDR